MEKHLQPNKGLEKKLNYLAVVVSIAVLALVMLMRRPEFKIKTDIDFSFLPPFHSTLNAIAAVALIAALYFIKNKNMKAHAKAIYAAMVLSAMFLLSYVVYHFTNDAVLFGDANFDGVVDPIEKNSCWFDENYLFTVIDYSCNFSWNNFTIYPSYV